MPPIIVIKKDQVLLQLQSKDFSIIGEKSVSNLYEMMANLHIKANIVQTHAVNLQLAIDNDLNKVQKFAIAASKEFDVQVINNLTLLSIRHYDIEIINKLTTGKTIVLKQQNITTFQVLFS